MCLLHDFGVCSKQWDFQNGGKTWCKIGKLKEEEIKYSWSQEIVKIANIPSLEILADMTTYIFDLNKRKYQIFIISGDCEDHKYSIFGDPCRYDNLHFWFERKTISNIHDLWRLWRSQIFHLWRSLQIWQLTFLIWTEKNIKYSWSPEIVKITNIPSLEILAVMTTYIFDLKRRKVEICNKQPVQRTQQGSTAINSTDCEALHKLWGCSSAAADAQHNEKLMVFARYVRIYQISTFFKIEHIGCLYNCRSLYITPSIFLIFLRYSTDFSIFFLVFQASRRLTYYHPLTHRFVLSFKTEPAFPIEVIIVKDLM